MALLGIKVDIDGARRGLEMLRTEQLPFTIARALTKTVQDGQVASRRLEGEVFKLRNDWIVKNTRIKAATKQSLVAEVSEDTRDRKGSAPDYISDQQDGAVRSGFVRWNGGIYRAIPTKYLNPFDTVIPRELAAQNLLNAVNGRYTVTVTKRIGDMKYLRNSVRRQRRVQTMAFFVVTLKDGTLALCGRNAGTSEAIPFYILATTIKTEGIFPMHQTVADVAAARFPENFRTAAIETMASDLLRGSGLQIKL